MAWQANNIFSREIEMEMKIDSVRWKSRFPNAGVDARTAYDAIEQIRSKKGEKFSATDVVAAAKAKCHPLHKMFEWDDQKAAHHFRVRQAQDLIRSLEVVYVKRPEEPVRAYEVIQKQPASTKPDAPRTLYSTHEEAVKDPRSRDALIKEAIAALMSWRRRFKSLNELDRVLTVIDETVDEFTQA